MQFIAATNNANKMAEMRRILTAMGHTVISQREAGVTVDPDENGATFAQNALIKAQAVQAAYSGSCAVISDDSGLCVNALDGAPGVYSARYCGRHGDDEANNDKLLRCMEAFVLPQQREAQFVSSICVLMPNGVHFIFDGVCEGSIGFERRGTNGFGYDPLFIPAQVGIDEIRAVPNTQKLTYAQLTADQKDAISHRGAALREMQRALPALLDAQNAE